MPDSPVVRIASLLPSATEIACALGFEPQLVARSHECDHPASVAALPVLTEPKLDVDASSRTIDTRVRELVSEGLSVYRVNAELLRELAPSVILTQDHCEVCAAAPKDLEDALAGWLGDAPQIVSLRPNSLGDVWGDVTRVAEVLGTPERGRALAAELATRVSEVAEQTQRLPDHPSVACIEWIDPLMGAGNWIPELVRLAGGRPLLGEVGAHSDWISFDALRDADPDVIVALPCGFDLARTRAEMRTLAEQPGFASLRAARDGRVFVADGHQYFNRPGPRLVESLEILAEILHPELGAPRYRGSAWERFAAPD